MVVFIHISLVQLFSQSLRMTLQVIYLRIKYKM